MLNQVTHQIFSQFQVNGSPRGRTTEELVRPSRQGIRLGDGAPCGRQLRMPYKPRHDAQFDPDSVVDEDLRVSARNLYVCDMSVMPLSSAANPVRTLVAFALRLSQHFG